MADKTWNLTEFGYGYDSGNILGLLPNRVRREEERTIGGSYRDIFLTCVAPHLRLDSNVVEFGPGRGAWTEAIFSRVTTGTVHTLDLQDVEPWLRKRLPRVGSRLVTHRVSSADYPDLPASHFDFLWCFGVFCHMDLTDVEAALRSLRPKLRPTAMCATQYSDYDKLERFGWKRSKVPLQFRDPNYTGVVWWVRNNQTTMRALLERAGYAVVQIDTNVVQRDSIAIFRPA